MAMLEVVLWSGARKTHKDTDNFLVTKQW
jgi:hypothetical protein